MLGVAYVTQPRLIEPGGVYLVTRRTLRRYHLFAPDPRMNRIFLYTLAVAATRVGVLVHTAVLMSTHEHLVVSDPEGRLPEFLHYLHRHVALATKVLRKWDGAVWDHESTSVVELRTPAAVAERPDAPPGANRATAARPPAGFPPSDTTARPHIPTDQESQPTAPSRHYSGNLPVRQSTTVTDVTESPTSMLLADTPERSYESNAEKSQILWRPGLRPASFRVKVKSQARPRNTLPPLG